MELSTLVEIIHDSECSLFLGAGASVVGGGPTSEELLREVHKKFPEMGNEKDFFRAFDRIMPNDEKRAEVESFLQSLFVSLTPKPENRYLLSLPWRAVMTTNYDSILDIIGSSLDKNRSLQIVYGSEPKVDIRREDYLYCFKLFGDSRISYSQDGHMVLTNSDRRRAYSRQAAYLKLFRDLVRTGNIVYIGYSFEDELVLDILHDLIFESRSFPFRGFAIMPNSPDEETLKKLAKHNIQWVKATLDDFVTEARRVFGDVPKSCSASMYPIRVHGNIVELDQTTRWNIKGKFKVINQGSFYSDYKDPSAFFEGKDQSFVPFRESWVFPRKWRLGYQTKEVNSKQFECIENLILIRSNSGSPSDNLIYALTGAAGSGKTVVGKRIAYEWYLSGNPVIFLDPNNMFIDSLAIQNLLDEIWNKYRKQLAEIQEPKTLRYLIICDNCSLLLPEIAQLSDHLTSEGKPVDILLIDRSSELTEDVLKEIGAVAAFGLDDTITHEERASFVDYFKGLNILPDMAALSANIDNPRINDSFFALTFTSIRESQVTLKDIIIKEYESKSTKVKRLYALTSLVQSYGLNAVQTIIIKSSDLLLSEVLANINSGNLRDVLVFNEEDQSFAAMHRVIAEIIRNHVFSTFNELKIGLTQIINMTTNGNIAEMSLVHKLLMECPEIQRDLPLQIIEDLYKQATKTMLTRPLFIQLANIQLRRGEYTDCRESINNAAKSEHPVFTEAKIHVFDVEGRLNMAIARDLMNEQTEDEDRKLLDEKAWTELEKAQVAFNQGKINPLITPHPYLGLAQTYELMEALETDRELRFNYCILALGVIQQLRSGAPSWFDPSKYLTIEQRVISKLSEANFDEIDAIDLFKKTHNANGYAYLAEKAAIMGHNITGLALVNKGMALDGKSSIWLTKTKIACLKKLYPSDYERIYDVVIEFQNQSPQYFDLDLTFELAKVQFIRGDWISSKKLFRSLITNQEDSDQDFCLLLKTDGWKMEGLPPRS